MGEIVDPDNEDKEISASEESKSRAISDPAGFHPDYYEWRMSCAYEQHPPATQLRPFHGQLKTKRGTLYAIPLSG